MSSCDMCGKESDLYKVEIEGAILDLCSKCSGFGKVIRKPAMPPPKHLIRQKGKPAPTRKDKATREIVQVIVPNFGEKIKKVRSNKGLTQEEFARKLNEKESIVTKIEKGQFKPSISLARKLEKILKINLVEEIIEEKIPKLDSVKKSGSFTMADFIKDKRKKK
ncbi:TIGR00270 family protein [Candidatus Woesearchaeota archaeon]|jgi:putative transcription factor|nr:TIGR00270 family protein [Candidatus Woesearchaeota archaeon]MBT6520218.1 TIGR00270 family protein [Candidatus Woesearchaeota archaeon]MBT7367229.1 TIGR00270 family protein [Candidatus Woesearchaeota archaeon]